MSTICAWRWAQRTLPSRDGGDGMDSETDSAIGCLIAGCGGMLFVLAFIISIVSLVIHVLYGGV